MQRQAGTSRAVEAMELPLYNKNSIVSKKEISRSRLAGKLVHLIPVVVLLCLFILWWFSYPVNKESDNGWVTTAYQLMAQNASFFHITFPPYPLISEIPMVSNDGIAQ